MPAPPTDLPRVIWGEFWHMATLRGEVRYCNDCPHPEPPATHCHLTWKPSSKAYKYFPCFTPNSCVLRHNPELKELMTWPK